MQPLILHGTIYEVVQDNRDEGRALVRIELVGVKTRPAFSLTYAQGSLFGIGQGVRITLQVQE